MHWKINGSLYIHLKAVFTKEQLIAGEKQGRGGFLMVLLKC